MKPPSSLERLVKMLAVRKKLHSGPYTLLLTSALSLTPEVLRDALQMEGWTAFQAFLCGLGQRERIDVLSHALSSQPSAGYRSLARLIREGYFSMILTTNLDSQLETALLLEGLQPTPFQTLVVGRDPDEHIVTALEKRQTGIYIVKLHGSLSDGILPATFPDFFEIPGSLQSCLKQYLNQDLIVVGSIEQDYDIQRLLNRHSGGSIYYALPQKQVINDTVIKVMKAREHDPDASVIAGPYGSFERFFKTLEVMLLSQETPQLTKLEILEVCSERAQIPSERAATPKVDVLLVTATDVEAQVVLKRFPDATRYFVNGKTYYDLGVIHEAKIAMVRSEMGAIGPGAALLTISESIRALSPSATIMVGIAFGVDPKNQAIGHILVSRQIAAYEPQKISSGPTGAPVVTRRGDRLTASSRLLDRFSNGYMDWQGPKVHFGLILSGEKLIDNLDYRNSLCESEPEAIGGDMEGAALSVAARHYKVDWILVKAICDWADGNKSQSKEQRQKKAALNAVLFTIHVLKQGGFTA